MEVNAECQVRFRKGANCIDWEIVGDSEAELLMNVLLLQRKGLGTLCDTRTDKLLPFQNGLPRRQKFPVCIYLEDVRFRSVA